MLRTAACWVDIEGSFVFAAGLDATDALLALLLGPEVEDGLQSVSWHLLLSTTLLPKLTNADLSEALLFSSLLTLTGQSCLLRRAGNPPPHKANYADAALAREHQSDQGNCLVV